LHNADAVEFDGEGRGEPGGESESEALDGEVLEEEEGGRVEEAVESGGVEAKVGEDGEGTEEP